MGTKPLIFLRPLSERLIQLKESIESTAEEENIEIYDIESLEELNQLIHHLGQFLLLVSTPKLCANFLQINSRKIRNNQSKIILISAQYFPPKIVDRLNKLGLTDLILESVAPKTFQYKVKLQLRSITAQTEEESEVTIKQDEEEEKYKSAVKASEEESKGNALFNLKKILDSDANKEKSYPGKASLVIKEDIDPETVLSVSGENEQDEEENLKAKSTAEKINNFWSKKKQSFTSKNDIAQGSIEGKSSTDKLQKESAGQIGEKEKSIATHWNGNIGSANKGKEKEDSEGATKTQKNEKHYEGSSKDKGSIKQDLVKADCSFQDNKKDSMIGDSKSEKSERDLTGENKKKADKALGNMIGAGKTASINDELEANVEELRNLNKNSSLRTDLSLNSFDENDLKADVKEKVKVKEKEKLDRNLRNDSNASKTEDDPVRSRLKKATNNPYKKIERTSLLDQVKKNRTNKNEDVDGFMRSPNFRKANETTDKDPKETPDEIDMAVPIEEKTPTFSPSDFASDLFEDDEGLADTENQVNDALSGKGSSDEYEDLEGDNVAEKSLSAMSGESERSEELEDLKGKSNKASTLEGYSGESTVDQIEGDALYGNAEIKNASIKEDEDLLKKKLEELYALKEKKLQELRDKKKKAAALNTEEDYYKKERDWDENAFSMDKISKKRSDSNLSPVEYGSSGQGNLEAILIDRKESENKKKNSYSEEILELRSHHEKEEIKIDLNDLNDLTDMERELINSNKDWGEQTIDYSKLKAGQEAISTDRESSSKEFNLKITEKEVARKEESFQGIVIDGDIEDETTEEEGEKLFHPDSKGIESVIKILNLYFDKDIMPGQVLNKTADLINTEKGMGVVSFFYKKFKTDEYTEILNGHSLFSNDERLDMWEDDKKIMVKNWASVKLPTWSDKTFREKKIDFIYPYYEGVDHLGFAIVNFAHGMKIENVQRIEITLEAARAVYLTQRHKENGDEAIYTEKKEITPLPSSIDKIEEGFMKGSDNLIFLEKDKADKKALEVKLKENEKPSAVKKLWKRMFG